MRVENVKIVMIQYLASAGLGAVIGIFAATSDVSLASRADTAAGPVRQGAEIGRASCRETWRDIGVTGVQTCALPISKTWACHSQGSYEPATILEQCELKT